MVMTAKSINRISWSGGFLTHFWIIFQFIYQFLGDKLAFSSKIATYNIYKEGFTLHMDALDIRNYERPLSNSLKKLLNLLSCVFCSFVILTIELIELIFYYKKGCKIIEMVT